VEAEKHCLFASILTFICLSFSPLFFKDDHADCYSLLEYFVVVPWGYSMFSGEREVLIIGSVFVIGNQ
jgi:hypothetical protein